MGHARALISLKSSEDQITIWQKTIKGNLSVRQVEKLVQELSTGKLKPKQKKHPRELPHYLREIEDRFRQNMATQVQIKPGKKGGKIEVEYYDDDDLMRLVAIVENTK